MARFRVEHINLRDKDKNLNYVGTHMNGICNYLNKAIRPGEKVVFIKEMQGGDYFEAIVDTGEELPTDGPVTTV